MSDHSLFSPSGSHTWVACPASIPAVLKYCDPSEDITNKYQQEGIDAHDLAAKLLETKLPISKFTHKFKGDDVEAIEDYIEYVDQYMSMRTNPYLIIEQRVAVKDIHSTCFGTADAVIVSDDHLDVIDLKFGRGVPVNAENNSQLMIYALGIISDDILWPEPLPDDFPVSLHISQPRIIPSRFPSDFEKCWETTVGKIRNFGKRAKAAADIIERALDNATIPEEHYNPGEKQCKWCKVKPICRAHRDYLFEEFDACGGDAGAAPYFEYEDIEKIFLKKSQIIGFFEAVEEYLKTEIERESEDEDYPKTSECFPSIAVDYGRSRKIWDDTRRVDIVKALDAVGVNPFKPDTLIGVTDGRKALTPEVFKELTQTQKGQIKVVKK